MTVTGPDSQYAALGFRGAGELVYHSAAWNAVARGVSHVPANTQQVELAAHAELLRDIIGPLLFRTVPVMPSWRTSEIIGLAQTMYDQRSFERMPGLADALEQAGCDNPEILGHCRERGRVHARGCWIVDLLLNKE